MLLYLRCSRIKLLEVIQSHAHTGLVVVLYSITSISAPNQCLVVTVYILQELVSRPIVTAHLGHECNHILHLVLYDGSLHQMVTWLLQNFITGCQAVGFVCHFVLSSYTQFSTVDINALPCLLFVLFSVAVLTVTGLFHDVGGLIIFLSILSIDVHFSLIHSSPHHFQSQWLRHSYFVSW